MFQVPTSFVQFGYVKVPGCNSPIFGWGDRFNLNIFNFFYAATLAA